VTTIIDIGVDWFTFTLRRDNPAYVDWRGRCVDFHSSCVDAGNISRQSTRLGYDGQSTTYSFVGQREADGIVIVSSSTAKAAFRYLWVDGVHVSRLDLQCTVMTVPGAEKPGITARKQATAQNPPSGSVGHRKISARDDNDGGYTLYIGSRSSAYFGRFYDKYAKSPDEYKPGAWRYEVQMHNEVATATCEQLQLMNGSLDGAIASSVWHWWADRGVTPLFEMPPDNFTIESPRAPPSDLERKLKWLASQVRPTVKLLWNEIDRDILFLALGLPTEGRYDEPLDNLERGT
jgi:DNA relaxase NicK